MKKLLHLTKKIGNKKNALLVTKHVFWFSVGALLGLFLLISFTFIFFEKEYNNKIYPGVIVNGVNFGGKTQNDVKQYFAKKNYTIARVNFLFVNNNLTASASARDLEFGFDQDLLAQQAYSIGRSESITSNISLVLQAYTSGITLPPAYHFTNAKLTVLLDPIVKKLTIQPVDALFKFENGKVITFQLSRDGQAVDLNGLENDFAQKAPLIMALKQSQTFVFQIPTTIVKPRISTDNVNSLGIKELIATGTSLFQHSIPNRIFNITLAASRINGALIAPNEVFSFDKTLGDISSFTGYKEAYVIQNGHTVLGDGGGVCQVSTTLFRALLNAGLPILERHAHDYRVGYYEENSPPGFDATIFVPTDDLKFKNDTGHYILIQSSIDTDTLQLSFMLYGTKDNRTIAMTTPVVINQTPAPPDLNQDDPTLPKGTVKQIDFAAAGATVSFSRTVQKDGQTMIYEKYVSNYKPWQAIYLHGTQ